MFDRYTNLTAFARAKQAPDGCFAPSSPASNPLQKSLRKRRPARSKITVGTKQSTCGSSNAPTNSRPIHTDDAAAHKDNIQGCTRITRLFRNRLPLNFNPIKRTTGLNIVKHGRSGKTTSPSTLNLQRTGTGRPENHHPPEDPGGVTTLRIYTSRIAKSFFICSGLDAHVSLRQFQGTLSNARS